MKNVAKIGFILSLSFIVAVSSCKKKEEFPIEPVIEFMSFTPFKDSAKLVLKFTDGDGDIGLSQSDTTAPYEYNLFMKYFEKQQGIWTERILFFPFNYRIPVLVPEGKKKPIQGEILVDIKPNYFDPFSPYDTIRYDIHILDKALHPSNTITTPEIITK